MSLPFRIVDAIAYLECETCEFIFADPEFLKEVDEGRSALKYDDSYWNEEMQAARERAFGPSLARVAETLLYARRPVKRFLDIGTGPGLLLDALQVYLPHAAKCFYGIELFPPPSQFRSKHPNYVEGELVSVGEKFQAGVCIEVLEHLTPIMARKLAEDLARVSEPGAFYIFNTGLVDYVKKEDPQYLDPFQRGHITVWSVKAARRIFEPAGFSVLPIPGKTWAFAVEFLDSTKQEGTIVDRIWTACKENKDLLHSSEMGSVLYILGLESARAYVNGR